MNILYLAGHENEPVQQTLYKADGSVFDLTGYTPSFILRLEFDAANAFSASGAGHVDVVGPAVNGTVLYTPSDGEYTGAGMVVGIYLGFWVATQTGRTKHFDAGRFEVRKGF